MKSRAYDDQASNALGGKLASGEPVAVKAARRVRGRASGNGPFEAPRPAPILLPLLSHTQIRSNRRIFWYHYGVKLTNVQFAWLSALPGTPTSSEGAGSSYATGDTQYAATGFHATLLPCRDMLEGPRTAEEPSQESD